MKTITLLIIIITAFGCNQKFNSEKDEDISDVEKVKKQKHSLDGYWELYKVNDTIFAPKMVYGFGDKQPFLYFDTENDIMSGNTGCNDFGGKAKITDGDVTVYKSFFKNELDCGNQLWEDDYLRQLANIKSYVIDEKMLKVYGKDGTTLEFKLNLSTETN